MLCYYLAKHYNYAKIAEVFWKNKALYQGIVLCIMDTFHTMCNVLGKIGKRFQDAGLRDICIKSGIIAEGLVNLVTD